MTFFIDANVIIYTATPSEYRDACVEILEAVARGDVDGRTSTAVLEEVWHVELRRSVGVIDGTTQHAYASSAPPCDR